jgi:hypothetical protein
VKFLTHRKKAEGTEQPATAPANPVAPAVTFTKELSEFNCGTFLFNLTGFMVFVNSTDLPVKPGETTFVHMDQVEVEKLAWMQDLPQSAAGDSKVEHLWMLSFLHSSVG